MARIRLLIVENLRAQKKLLNQQTLVFLMKVENLAYHKQVDVLWSGADGVWHVLPARYRGQSGDSQEYWQARTTLSAKSARALPGDIRFSLRLRCQTGEYWDNNGGTDYYCIAGSGVVLGDAVSLQNMDVKERLDEDQQFLPVKVAVDPALNAEAVVIHWTVDNWRHSRQTPCRQGKQSKQTGVQLWSTRLKVSDAFRVQYSICCKTGRRELWDNNCGKNYQVSRTPLKLLILNLHCYQEDRQDFKFSQIAKAIDELDADVVCFQEVAEHWNNGHGDWPSNAANIINQRLKHPMHLYTDWSHLGFDRYREGVAIMSRYPLHHRHSLYVSDSQDIYSIHSRKVVMAQIHVPHLGAVNVFSAHLSWWEDGFQQQFQRLCDWAGSLASSAVKATLLCGDFNIAAGSIGYQQVVSQGQYEDQYLAVNQQGLFQKIFRVNDPHWQHYLGDDYRIDYVFMNKNSDLCAVAAKVLFTEQDYGRVSDHCGYLMAFEPK